MLLVWCWVMRAGEAEEEEKEMSEHLTLHILFRGQLPTRHAPHAEPDPLSLRQATRRGTATRLAGSRSSRSEIESEHVEGVRQRLLLESRYTLEYSRSCL